MILSNDYIEIENFLPLEKQEALIKLLTHPSFPWALSLDAVYGAEGKTIDPNAAIGFFHTCMYKGEQCSEYLNSIGWIIDGLEDATYNRIRIDKLNRIRIGLFTQHPNPNPHYPHVDADFDHWTCVYYVNDCDGDLIVYNESFPNITQDDAKTSRFSVKKICRPAQGKLVAFNGKYYHASSYPTKKPLRIAVTFNFTVL